MLATRREKGVEKRKKNRTIQSSRDFSVILFFHILTLWLREENPNKSS
jgi:hypothetical protein